MNALVTTLATLAVPGVFCFVVPYFILRATHEPLLITLGILQVLALALAALGVAMVVWVSFSFVRYGRGTPVPIDPPKQFVSHGLYRWVRNPMYVGALLAIVGVVIFYGSAVGSCLRRRVVGGAAHVHRDAGRTAAHAALWSAVRRVPETSPAMDTAQAHRALTPRRGAPQRPKAT